MADFWDNIPAISGFDDASQARIICRQSGRPVHAPVLNIGLQPLDADLTALAENINNGLWARTGPGTGAARSLAGTLNQITVVNPDGVAGNPTIALARPFTLGTPVAANTGTSVTVTGIPDWARLVIVSLHAVSTNGTSAVLLQLGDSGGPETTGYNAAIGIAQAPSSATAIVQTTGFQLPSGAASATRYGSVFFSLMNPTNNLWAAQGVVVDTVNTVVGSIGGTKALSATLDRIRLIAANGTDAFDDSGSLNIAYAG